MRAALSALAAAALIAAGCGDDGDSGSGGAKPEQPKAGGATAASFIECFEKPGYGAKRPKPREESVLAFQAKSNGFKVEPVNVSETGMLTPAAFIVFFESPAKAAEAIEELDATSYGEVPPVTRGPAVIGYGDKESQAAVGAAVDGCIG